MVRRVAIVAAVISGVGLVAGGVQGMAALDGRLSEATPRPVTREVDLKQELRHRDGDCPARKQQQRRRDLTEL